MKKKVFNVIIITITISILTLLALYLIDCIRMSQNKPVIFSTWGKSYTSTLKENGSTKLKLVLSLEDTIDTNTAWCGTFNLIWNDLKNDLAKQDIEFNPQLDIVRNLNKETFNTSYLSEKSYYKKYGIPTLELKQEIEKAIKKKFNETSDILDGFNWGSYTDKDYFLYSMLKKEFEFPQVFTELKPGTFGNYSNVKYFGIDNTTDEKVRDQVSVLYYNSKDDFAIKIDTKQNDEVVISKGSKKDNFLDIYNELEEIRESSYLENKLYGDPSFSKNDILKIPNISFSLKEDLQEIENKPFSFSNGDLYCIEKALQTIEFEIDRKGGRIKSEAGMAIKNAASIGEAEPRKFIVDDTFVIFLKEKNKKLPYFAAKISDISQVQNDVTFVEQ